MVGLTTTNQYEHRHGRGLEQTGGHSGGARVWYDTTHGIRIVADGFNYSHGGEIVDTLMIRWCPYDSKNPVPKIHLSKMHVGILEKLHYGLSIKEVEKSLHLQLKTGRTKQSGLIRYSSIPMNKDNDRFSAWDCDFWFGAKGLEGFQILAD